MPGSECSAMGNLHAIILILLPILTAVACLRFRRRIPPPSQAVPPHILASAGRSPVTGRKLRKGRSVLGEVLVCTVFAYLAAAMSGHACLAGQAVTQLLIPWVCLVGVVVFMGEGRIRLLLAATQALLLLGLTLSYSGIVHGPIYVGNRAHGRIHEVRNIKDLRAVSTALLKLAEGDEATYPAGWLSEAPFLETLRAELRWWPPEGHRLDVLPLWHSWLTGLYLRRLVAMDVWYPGGKLKDAAGNLEYRERPR